MKKRLRRWMAAALMAVVMVCALPVGLHAAEEADDWEALIGLDMGMMPSYELSGLNLTSLNDGINITVDVDITHDIGLYFSMFAYDYTTCEWSMIGGWQKGTEFMWYPDANDEYALVVYAAQRHSSDYVNSKGEFKSENVSYSIIKSYWQSVSRPQMNKRVTADCAAPTSGGLLFGCASNVTASDSNFCTTCYIYSFGEGTWIAQAPYRASGSAWFKVSDLKPGTYMMYTCTEKIENGQRRKLSCKYYVFNR